jgi:hypothetical protein
MSHKLRGAMGVVMLLVVRESALRKERGRRE